VAALGGELIRTTPRVFFGRGDLAIAYSFIYLCMWGGTEGVCNDAFRGGLTIPRGHVHIAENENKMVVFILHHVAREDAADEDWKLLGVYSSEETATAAINRFRPLPGFRDYPDGFRCEPYELDKESGWAEGFGFDF
jgi:hypothetical protein